MSGCGRRWTKRHIVATSTFGKKDDGDCLWRLRWSRVLTACCCKGGRVFRLSFSMNQVNFGLVCDSQVADFSPIKNRGGQTLKAYPKTKVVAKMS